MLNKSGSNPTLDDVARRARVSTATVSRSLNEPDRVRKETLDRVRDAVDALGYTPHFGGQALASNRTNTIGAVIPTMANAIFARGIQSLEEALGDAGVTLLVASSNYDPDREAAQVRALLGRGVDGLLLIGAARPETTYELLRKRDARVVLAWTAGAGATTGPAGRADGPVCVGFDNRASARAMADCVLDMGHRDVAMISGLTEWNDRADDRVVGLREALAARGLALAPERLIEAAYSLDAGDDAFRALWARGERPTVVMCGNDVLAAGALRAARRLSLDVPGEVSITGFDDIDLAEAVEPGLTTVHVPHRRMGRSAAAALLALRAGEDPDDAPPLETSIVLRGSLGPPR